MPAPCCGEISGRKSIYDNYLLAVAEQGRQSAMDGRNADVKKIDSAASGRDPDAPRGSMVQAACFRSPGGRSQVRWATRRRREMDPAELARGATLASRTTPASRAGRTSLRPERQPRSLHTPRRRPTCGHSGPVPRSADTVTATYLCKFTPSDKKRWNDEDS